MIFIFTCSQCETTDIVMREFDGDDILRFNIDKPEDFAWDFHQYGFRIVDKTTGRDISNKTFTSFYLRKPIFFNRIDVPWFGCIENWRREETTELFSDFFRECQSRGLVALVRSQDNKYGKLRQLIAAKEYFRVAPWHFFHGELPEELKQGRWVVKSMTSTPIGKDKMFFVKEVNPRALDLSYPWFAQERIDGKDAAFAFLADLDLQPLGEGVDDRGADAVQAAGDLVAPAAELAARVQNGENHLKGGLAGLLLDIHGDAAAVIRDADDVARLDDNLDMGAVAGERLVDGVVHDLIYQVVQAG